MENPNEQPRIISTREEMEATPKGTEFKEKMAKVTSLEELLVLIREIKKDFPSFINDDAGKFESVIRTMEIIINNHSGLSPHLNIFTRTFGFKDKIIDLATPKLDDQIEKISRSNLMTLRFLTLIKKDTELSPPDKEEDKDDITVKTDGDISEISADTNREITEIISKLKESNDSEKLQRVLNLTIETGQIFGDLRSNIDEYLIPDFTIESIIIPKIREDRDLLPYLEDAEKIIDSFLPEADQETKQRSKESNSFLLMYSILKQANEFMPKLSAKFYRLKEIITKSKELPSWSQKK